MIGPMAHVQNITQNSFRNSQGAGLFLEIDLDTVDNGTEFKALAYSVEDGRQWKLWSAPDGRPVDERSILGLPVRHGAARPFKVTLL